MLHAPLFLAALVVTVGPGLLMSGVSARSVGGAQPQRAQFSNFAQFGSNKENPIVRGPIRVGVFKVCMECSESDSEGQNHETSGQLSSLRSFIQELFDSAKADKGSSTGEGQEKDKDASTGTVTGALDASQSAARPKPRAPRARPSPLKLEPIGRPRKMMLAHHQRIWDVRRQADLACASTPNQSGLHCNSLHSPLLYLHVKFPLTGACFEGNPIHLRELLNQGEDPEETVSNCLSCSTNVFPRVTYTVQMCAHTPPRPSPHASCSVPRMQRSGQLCTQLPTAVRQSASSSC